MAANKYEIIAYGKLFTINVRGLMARIHFTVVGYLFDTQSDWLIIDSVYILEYKKVCVNVIPS